MEEQSLRRRGGFAGSSQASEHDMDMEKSKPEYLIEPARKTEKIDSTPFSVSDPSFFSSIDRFVCRHERFVPYLILIIAAFSRYYRLALPSGVIFDESHFVRFTNQYTAGTYFFDIHPPLGKLTLWFMGKLVGYNDPDPTTRPFMSLPSDCTYETISEEYPEGCKYYYLRLVAATFSTLTVLVMYLLSRKLGYSVWGGILSSTILLFDFLNMIQGRAVLLDAQLSFWALTSFYVGVCWWKRWDEHTLAEDLEWTRQHLDQVSQPSPTTPLSVQVDSSPESASTPPSVAYPPTSYYTPTHTPRFVGDSHPQERVYVPGVGVTGEKFAMKLQDEYKQAVRERKWSTIAPMLARLNILGYRGLYTPVSTMKPRLMSARERILWCVLVGLVCANSASIKMTGLATPAIVALESFFGFFFLRRALPFMDLLLILVVAIVVYSFYFAVHFKLLFRSGDGDGFMSPQFQSTLVDSHNYNPNAKWEGFLYNLITLNARMVKHNANILAPHPWQSSWNEWVFNERGVSYYGKDFPETYTDHIYLVGNHVIHLSVIIAMVVFTVLSLFYIRYLYHNASRSDGFSLTKVLSTSSTVKVASFDSRDTGVSSTLVPLEHEDGSQHVVQLPRWSPTNTDTAVASHRDVPCLHHTPHQEESQDDAPDSNRLTLEAYSYRRARIASLTHPPTPAVTTPVFVDSVTSNNTVYPPKAPWAQVLVQASPEPMFPPVHSQVPSHSHAQNIKLRHLQSRTMYNPATGTIAPLAQQLHSEASDSRDKHFLHPIQRHLFHAREQGRSLWCALCEKMQDTPNFKYRRFFAIGSYLLLTYALNLLPYLGVKRSTFIYHYMPALLCGELLVALVLDQLSGKQISKVTKGYILMLAIVFLYFSPWIFAMGLTNDGHQRRRWNPRWN